MYKRDKWEKLKNLINADISHAVHYSSDKLFEHSVSLRYKNYMEAIDTEENWYKEYLRYMENDDESVE
jgi:hypothetical protein